MAKFAIRITETLARTVIVDSDDLDEAIQKVKDAVSEDKIILTSDDYDEREIFPAAWSENGKVPENKDVSFYEHFYVTTCIYYLYRDADNYKKLNKIIVPGRYTNEQINEIISSLSEGQWFIPSMIGFPEEKIDDKETDADHPWFELETSDFEPSNEKPDIDKSPEEIVALFKSTKGHWEEGALLC